MIDDFKRANKISGRITILFSYLFALSQLILQTFLTFYKAIKVKRSDGYLNISKLHNFYYVV